MEYVIFGSALLVVIVNIMSRAMGGDTNRTIQKINEEAEKCRNYRPTDAMERLRKQAQKQQRMADKLNKKWPRRAAKSYKALYRRRLP